MYIEQLYTGCLSEAAYYIESKGEAAIIDPLRDIETYIELARERNSTIKYIFETHFHADFVSLFLFPVAAALSFFLALVPRPDLCSTSFHQHRRLPTLYFLL